VRSAGNYVEVVFDIRAEVIGIGNIDQFMGRYVTAAKPINAMSRLSLSAGRTLNDSLPSLLDEELNQSLITMRVCPIFGGMRCPRNSLRVGTCP
jgi:hypothetical protein